MLFRKIILLLSWVALPLYAQNSFEIEREMPVAYQQMKQKLNYPMAWENNPTTDFGQWRSEARVCLESFLLNRPEQVPFDPEILATEQRQGYEVRKIRFNLSEFARINAYLLMPQGTGPFPALIMLHDHGAKFSIGKEKMVKPFGVADTIAKESEEWMAKCYDSIPVADLFASKGYAVLVTDALFWGERGRKEGVDYLKQETLAANLLQMGMCWSGQITFDDALSAEFLASVAGVDPDRIGSLGFSLGGHRSWMVSALSDRIQAAASISWMNTTEHLMELKNNQTRGQSAHAMLVPGLRNHLDYPHVAAIACPKPALYFAGTRDKLFPIAGVQKAFSILRETYASQQASDKLVTKTFDETHFFNRNMQQETLEFFDRWLK